MSTVSLYTAVSALQAHQQFMSVVANNLANVNTTAFKGSRVLFSDALSQTIRHPTSASGTNSGSNGAQIGLGTSLGSITPVFSQGAMQSTGLPLDLAIEGDGFFVAFDAVSSTTYYTRAGALNMQRSEDPAILGTLVTPTGQTILGAAITAPATAAADGDALGNVDVPVQVNGVNVRQVTIDSSGRVIALLEDGSSAPIFQLTLQRFSNPEGLEKTGNNLYTSTPAAGLQFPPGGSPGTDVFETPGTGGTGKIRSGFLELSNVDLGQEFSDMIRAQRGLQANTRVITTSDEIMQELINLKR